MPEVKELTGNNDLSADTIQDAISIKFDDLYIDIDIIKNNLAANYKAYSNEKERKRDNKAKGKEQEFEFINNKCVITYKFANKPHRYQPTHEQVVRK